MPEPARPLAGVVLCGGRSRRMGRQKALVEFEGEPLVVRAARRLAGVADPVFLAPGVPGRLGPLAWPEVPDALPDAGPLAGIVAGLAASPHELAAVVAVDLPFAEPALLAFLASIRAEEDAVVPRADGRLQPVHAVYAATALAPLRTALGRGERSVLAALAGLDVRIVEEDTWRPLDPAGRFAVNANRPEDLPGAAEAGGVGR